MIFVPFQQVLRPGSCKQEAQNIRGGPLRALNLWRHIWRLSQMQLTWLRQLSQEFHADSCRIDQGALHASPFSLERREEIFLSCLACGGYHRQPALSLGLPQTLMHIRTFMKWPTFSLESPQSTSNSRDQLNSRRWLPLFRMYRETI